MTVISLGGSLPGWSCRHIWRALPAMGSPWIAGPGGRGDTKSAGRHSGNSGRPSARCPRLSTTARPRSSGSQQPADSSVPKRNKTEYTCSSRRHSLAAQPHDMDIRGICERARTCRPHPLTASAVQSQLVKRGAGIISAQHRASQGGPPPESEFTGIRQGSLLGTSSALAMASVNTRCRTRNLRARSWQDVLHTLKPSANTSASAHPGPSRSACKAEPVIAFQLLASCQRALLFRQCFYQQSSNGRR